MQMKRRQEMNFGYSMPSVAPLYQEPPYYYKGNNVITITFRTTPEILRELVPAPLVPNPDNVAFIYIGNFNVVSPVQANYREVGIGIPAVFKGILGGYFAYLYLDQPHAIVPGREIWGWPKKDAEIKYIPKKGKYSAHVYREGVTLVKASVNAIEQVTPIPDQPGLPAYNLKLVPSVKKNHAPDVLQLTSAVTVSKKKELFRGEANLTLASSESDPLGRMQVLEILGGEQYIEDLSLDCGDVLFDYLSDKPKGLGEYL
jgi:acetoacetate decarboxylase